jgi:hypothetical protein
MNINVDNYKNFSYFIVALITLSVFVAYLLDITFKEFGITIPFYIEVPSVSGIYVALFTYFNNVAWKNPLFQKLGILIADDLNGSWVGTIKSSHDKFKSDIYAKLIIEQSATKIKIYGQFNESKSVSIHENFGSCEVDNKVALFYFFRNEPEYDAVETMSMHEGSAKLIYDKKTNSLKGNYYSGRDRNNYGMISLKKLK